MSWLLGSGRMFAHRRLFGAIRVSELIAGVDEVRRGPLAGPVVAVAVIFGAS